MPPVLSRLGASLPLPPDVPMCRRVAERAEALGYESLWVADTGAGPDAYVVAAVAAYVSYDHQWAFGQQCNACQR